MKSVMQHQFSQAPTADIPRSSFNRSHGYKTTFDAGDLIPFFSDEALPGDTFTLRPSMFARLATPIYPIMDNMFLDVHFFSVPVRQVWANFRKFMGEQEDPGDSTDYLVPQVEAEEVGGWAVGSLGDYFGLPIGAQDMESSALFFRAYNHIYNEWYRDQNLIDSATVRTVDSPDAQNLYPVRKRGKRHDYFTSCLPWPQKGDSVQLSIGGEAPVLGLGVGDFMSPAVSSSVDVNETVTGDTTYNDLYSIISSTSLSNNQGSLYIETDISDAPDYRPNIRADLSTATASTINELRQAFQIQKLLERDARSGTRYAEIVKAHFGVDFLDVTYRPEFLGGTSTPINIHPVADTAGQNDNQPVGSLAGFGTASLDSGGFTKSFTEHSIVIGICSIRADLTYQQGLERMHSRQTRYDFYWPTLAHLGEQAVLNKEIYFNNDGDTTDNLVFGYQERYAEYRYKQSKVTGLFRSDAPSTLDAWHLSQDFSTTPSLNETFITEDPPLDRCIAVPSEPHMILDCYMNFQCARPMPIYSVPGLIDHF